MTDAVAPLHIVRRPGPRPDLLIFDILSDIHAADVEAMAAEVDAAIDAFDRLDILLVFKGFESASVAALTDLKGLRTALRSNAHIRRYGVVGAPAVAAAMIRLFDPLTPVDAKTFGAGEFDAPMAWINAAE